MTSPVAIITGAGGGIGRATAVELSSRGFQLVLCGRRIETLRETSALVQDALVQVTDVTIPDQINHLVDRAMTAFGRIDLIVNNAGHAPVLGIQDMSIQQWHEVIDTNLSAAFYLSKAVWPVFRRQNAGVIVNVSSLAARDPFPGFAAYAAAKGGLNLLGLSLAREGAKMNIRVYTVAPGAVETAMFRAIMTTEQVPQDQTLAPEDIARVIGQCAAGDLRFTSGEVIWVRKTP